MNKLPTTGEEFTTMSVSALVSETIQKRKGAMTMDDYLRHLLGLPVQNRKRGRPPNPKKRKATKRKKPPKKNKLAKKQKPPKKKKLKKRSRR